VKPGDFVRFNGPGGLGLSLRPGKLKPGNPWVGAIYPGDCVLVVAVVRGTDLNLEDANTDFKVPFDEALILRAGCMLGCMLGWTSCYYIEFEVLS
jgi:hypothetical protein